MPLYILATPIGNLNDLSDRAREILSKADSIVCEDTRVTSRLLAAKKIQKPLRAFHHHSTSADLRPVLEALRNGKTIAYVSDAGTPGISDPGGKLVEAVVCALPDVAVIPIPGPCAAVAALSVCGFPADRFSFFGFPPHKKGRNTFFDELAANPSTIVLYESTHRILKTLDELRTRIGERQIVVCRELTKIHETTYRGTAREVTTALSHDSLKGEFVIVIAQK